MENIKNKLNYFLKTSNVPNIIFHGDGEIHNIVYDFIQNIYDKNVDYINEYVMEANCAHGKGIKFIRDELKFFAKTHINFKSTNKFKIILLVNADKLTTDAQSALRRCIELHNHTTRFFLIVNNKNNLLKPILSRFCDIYIKNSDEQSEESFSNKTYLAVKRQLNKLKYNNYEDLIKLTNSIYESGGSGLDLIKYIENNKKLDKEKKYKLLIHLNSCKQNFKYEPLFILYVLNLIIRFNDELENIVNMY